MKILRRAPRPGDGKFSFIPNDEDHNGWLLLQSTVRLVGKVQYAKLFAVLGTKFGGTTASTTFGLPPAGDHFLLTAGSKYGLGSTGGAETVKLTAVQMPKHNHAAQKVKIEPTAAQKALLTSVLGISLADITKPPTVSEITGGASGDAGGDEAHENMPPYLAVNVFIYAGMPQS